MATLPSMTLGELRTAVRERADMENSEFVTDATLNQWINESLFSLYDELVSAFGDDYYVADPHEFTTDGTNDTFALPSDFYKLLGVDLQITNSPNGWISLKPFPRAERNRVAGPGSVGLYGVRANIRYRLRQNKIWLTPLPASGQTVRLLYVPKMVPIGNPVTFTFTSVVNGNTFSIAGVSIIAGTTFDVGADDDETATNFADLMNDNPPVGLTSQGYSATVADNVVTLSQTSTTVSALTSSAATVVISADDLYPTETDGISGWLEYVIVDSAIKCLAKEESDTRDLERQRQRILERITTMAPDRDEGMPQRVSDVKYGMNGWDGGDDDGGWWN